MNAFPFLRIKRPLPADDQIDHGMRKIRKGTLSCWECKRRKVRCNFAESSGSICDGCRRRKTHCITQDLPDQLVEVDSYGQLHDRLVELEEVVHRLAQKVNVADGSGDLGPTHVLTEAPGSLHDVPSSNTNRLTSIVSEDCDQVHCQERRSSRRQRPSVNASLIYRVQEPDATGREHESLSRLLLKAWPGSRELDIILNLPCESSGFLHGTMCAPFSTKPNLSKPSLRQDLQVPPPGSHPVLIARKLLLLATHLQSLSPDCLRSIEKSSISYHAIMSSARGTAHACVTSNDLLLDSLEGVECIMIESMYQSNAGNLRSAWHSIGRGILVAQMMGLHRDAGSQSFKILDTETRTRVDPEYLWFRLIQMNRYLSLMLGLPQGTSTNNFADGQALENCTPAERMQRMDCAAGGYILQRNEAGLYDNVTTQMIDQMLQESAALLPSTWWLAPDLEFSTLDATKSLERVIRVIDQLTHFHLVSQLHLPNLLRSCMDHEYDYSKTMAVDASREVLKRFTSLNGVHSFTSFCRGISFLAFIACTTLCIAHIDAMHQHRGEGCIQENSVSWSLLANQRHKDCSMMELTLDCMERMAREDGDQIASRTSSVLKHLISMGMNDTLCSKYATSSTTEMVGRGLGCGGKVSDCGKILQIHIPYSGTIRFERVITEGSASTEA